MVETNTTMDIFAARLQHQLETQSRIIEETFRSYGRSQMHVTGGYVEHNALCYDIPGKSAGLPSRSIERELAQRLGVAVTIRLHANRMSVAVDRPQPPVDLLTLLAQSHLRDKACLSGVLGLDAQGKVVTLQMPQAGHVLVTDPQSRGKSSLLRTLAVSLALVSRPSQLQFVLIHGRSNDSLQPLDFLPPAYLLHPGLTDSVETGAVLENLAQSLRRPLNNGRSQPHVVVLWDDIDAALAKGQLTLLSPLIQLLKIRTNLSIIMTTSKAHDPIFHYIGDGIQTRILGETDPPSNASRWRGTFFLQAASQTATRYFQAAYADLYDLSFILSRMQQQGNQANGSAQLVSAYQVRTSPYLALKAPGSR